MSTSVRELMMLDSAVDMCRRIAARDLGANAGNTQSIRHVVNEFKKAVENKKLKFKYWWNVSEAFDEWIGEFIPSIVADEEILKLSYNMGDLEEPPHSTPTTEKEKSRCQTWKRNIPWYIRQVFGEHGIKFEEIFNIG